MAEAKGKEETMNPTIDSPRPYRWTREEFFQMIDLGWFQDKRVELIGGEILEMASQFDLHLASITATADSLRHVFGSGYWVRVQGNLDLSPHGIPEPDLAVTLGSYRGAGKTIAKSALLVVEVSDSSLAYDRSAKSSLYAAGSIGDYWIVNLVQRQLEVYRDPVADSTQLFGFRYNSRMILDPADVVSPLAAPQASITVADLLP
jgi:Uma2 family endonuclease